MDFSTLDAAIGRFPRHRVGFYPTTFHAPPSLSETLGVNVYLKREDLAGPGTISRSKTRLAEFVLGRALEQGVTHLITQGAYLTNSGLQFADGYRFVVVEAGGAHPNGFVAHAETFLEMLQQSRALGVELDFIYHALGTGTALPGMLAAKLSLGHPVAIRSYDEDDLINPGTIVARARAVLKSLGESVPDDATIRAEPDIDQRFIGEDHAGASALSTAAIRELARAEGVFVGPVYTGKGLAGLLDQARSGRLPAGGNVAFLHTGDTGNLFEIPEVVGAIRG